jgi:hypothetical protein
MRAGSSTHDLWVPAEKLGQVEVSRADAERHVADLVVGQPGAQLVRPVHQFVGVEHTVARIHDPVVREARGRVLDRLPDEVVATVGGEHLDDQDR